MDRSLYRQHVLFPRASSVALVHAGDHYWTILTGIDFAPGTLLSFA
jgi:hypothetical protein